MLRATIDWFEHRGKARLIADYHAHVFYSEFLEFIAEQGIFAAFLTPKREGDGAPDKRWDTSRVAAMSEILGFYGLNYWYPWQVTVLGLGPVWQSGNDVARKRAALRLGFRRCRRIRPVRAGARRRHLLHRHGVDAGRGGRLPRRRRQVLHRERQHRRRRCRCSGGSTAIKAPISMCSSTRTQSTRTSSSSRTLSPAQIVCRRVSAQRLPGARRGHPAHRRRGVLGRAQHRQHRQVQFVLRRDRVWLPTPCTRRSPTRTTGFCTARP